MDVAARSDSYLRRIAENLLEFQRGGDFCDVIVQLAGVELGAHSAVLAATSPPLRKLLAAAGKQDPRMSIIRLDGYDDVDVARLWLEFVYTGRCRLGSEKQLAEVRELCGVMRMPEPVCESSAPSSGLVGPDERSADLVYKKSCNNSELNADLTMHTENFGSPEAEEDNHCKNSVESISFEGIPQAIRRKESVDSSSVSLEERPLVVEPVTLDREKAVIPDNEKSHDDFHVPATRDTSDLESSSDCDQSPHPGSLSQTVGAPFPNVSASNSVRLSEPTRPNFGESFPGVVTSTQSGFRDSTATPPSDGCHGKKCNVCGHPCIVDACDGKAGETQTDIPFRCKCLDRGKWVVKSNGLKVKTRQEKAVQRTSRKRVHCCGLCSKAFGTHSGLFGHLSKQHPVTLLNETHCGICRNSFTSASDFLNHVIVFGGSNQNLRSSGRVCIKLSEGKARVLGIDGVSAAKRGGPRKKMPRAPDSESSSQVRLKLKMDPLELKMGSHKCPVCLEVFWTHASLYRHTAQHDFLHIAGECRPTCGICQTSFDDVSQLVEHVTSKAGQAALQKDDSIVASGDRKESAGVAAQQVFDCGYCDRSFESRSGLRSHVNMHLNGRPHKCPSCGNDFRFAKHLASHARMFHKISICSKCGINCSCSQEELKASEADGGDPTSRGKAFLTCHDCRKVFQSRKGYVNHRHIHDGVKSFVCEFCGRVFNRKDRLASHRSTHVSKAFPCTFCEKHFLSPARLREHTRTHSGECPLVCSHCGLRFRTRSALRVHFVRKHSPLLHGLKVVNFKCDVCARQFSSRTYLTMHRRWHSGRLRTFKCDVCRRGFYDACGLRSHMAMHAESREQPFLCYTCNKGFTSRGNLQTHVLSHGKDHSFVCERCNKGFKFKGHLNIHRKVDCRIGLCDGDIEFASEEVVVDV